MDEQGYIEINGKRLDVSNVHIDWKLPEIDQDAHQRLNDALRQLRQGVRATYNIDAADIVGATGPVVEGSIEKEQAE